MSPEEFVRRDPNATTSRAEARRAGVNVFRDTFGCKKGHSRSWRWVPTRYGRECLSCKWGLPTDRAIGSGAGRRRSFWRELVELTPNMEMTRADAMALGAPVFRDTGVCRQKGHVRPWRKMGHKHHCLSCMWKLPTPKNKRAVAPLDRRSPTRKVVEADPFRRVTLDEALRDGLFAYRDPHACKRCESKRPWRHINGGACLTCRWNLPVEGDENGR